MTYLEKLMSAVKIDDEILSGDEVRWLRQFCRAGVFRYSAPWDFPSLRFSPVSGLMRNEAWNYEMKEEGGR